MGQMSYSKGNRSRHKDDAQEDTSSTQTRPPIMLRVSLKDKRSAATDAQQPAHGPPASVISHNMLCSLLHS